MELLKEKLLQTNSVEGNSYLDLYIKLILDNLKTPKQINKTQSHHIIPRSYFSHSNLDVDDSKENLVNLLYKDHILAHYYLSLCSIGDYKLYNINAFLHMANQRNLKDFSIKNLEEYQNLYEEFSKYYSVKIRDHKPWKYNKGIPRKAMKESTKKLIGEINKQRSLNKFPIHKGDEYKRVYKDQIPNYILDGWEEGLPNYVRELQSKNLKGKPNYRPNFKQSEYQKQRVRESNSHPKRQETKDKIRSKMTGSTFVYNESLRKGHYVKPEDLDYYLNNGYHLGHPYKNKN